MNADCIRFDQVPHSSKLFLDFLAHSPAQAPFYAAHTISAVAEYARSLGFDAQRRRAVADVLERQNREWEGSQATLASIERFRAGAVAVVSGQQVGLFGGPFYSILKAASALQLAAELSARGIDAVPVFWLATEDHDLAEVNQVALPGDDGRFEVATLPMSAIARGAANSPVGQVRFGAEIGPLVEKMSQLLGGELSAMLRSSYRAGETFGSAFGRLFSKLFAGTGLILMQPLEREVHALAAPVLLQAAEAAQELNQELLRRGQQLRNAGYHEQVKVTASSTLLFVFQDGERTVMHTAGDDFLVGAQRLSREEVLRRLREHPEQFSPNVLLRPVVQDYLLPTAAYFGGPAEIAYFAQAAMVYGRLLGRVTPVLPRLSATMVNTRMQRLLDRYGLQLPDLFDGEEKLRERIARRVLPAALQEQLEKARQAVEREVNGLTEQLKVLDATLAPAAEKAGRKMQYQLQRLAGKASRAELRKHEQLARHAAELMNGLFPGGHLQERTAPGILVLGEHGLDLLPKLVDLASAHCPGHYVFRV
ncbi:MAG: bacillithiol biosynthesis cysteine-adding enzyme BshC [Candidatus Korobacteraceae bacterium]